MVRRASEFKPPVASRSSRDDICPPCRCALESLYDRFAGAGTTVLPISVDSTATLKEYMAKYQLRHQLGMLCWQHTEAKLGDRRDDADLLRVIATL